MRHGQFGRPGRSPSGNGGSGVGWANLEVRERCGSWFGVEDECSYLGKGVTGKKKSWILQDPEPLIPRRTFPWLSSPASDSYLCSSVKTHLQSRSCTWFSGMRLSHLAHCRGLPERRGLPLGGRLPCMSRVSSSAPGLSQLALPSRRRPGCSPLTTELTKGISSSKESCILMGYYNSHHEVYFMMRTSVFIFHMKRTTGVDVG